MDAAFPPVPAPTPLSQWRARLRPWLHALQFKLRLDIAPLPSRDEICDVWLSLNYFATESFEQASWTQMLEALELLDLLVWVDGRVGWTLLLEMTDVDRVFRINEASLFDPATARPKYALELDDSDMLHHIGAAFEACRRMTELDYRPSRSDAFREMERLLRNAWRDQHEGQTFSRAKLGRIHIKPRVRIEDDHMVLRAAHELDLLAISIQLNRMRWAMMDEHEQLHVINAFVVVAVDLFFLSSEHACGVLVDALGATARRNVSISDLVLHPSLLGGQDTVLLFDKLLRPATGEGILSRLEFKCADLPESTIQSLCLALVRSRGVREFVLGGSEADNRGSLVGKVWLPWLAFALFSTQAMHQIVSVQLHANEFRVEHMRKMQDVLEHPDPLDLLCDPDSDSRETTRPLEWTAQQSPIKHLALDYIDPSCRRAVLELLRLVGASLDRLSLRHYGVESFSYEFMDAVLIHCPHLKRLEIAEAGVTFDWLLRAPRDGVRRVIPEQLVVEGRMENAAVLEFFHVLSDTSHPLAKSLKQLHYSMWPSRQPMFDAVDAWLEMLDSNRLLERSEVVLSKKGASAYQLAKFQERFEVHNGEPLVNKRKLAFLSVFLLRNAPKSVLSPETISLVMEFAWKAKRRICG